MAQVTVTINGRIYRVGCDDGQEEMLAGLAQDLDRHIEGFKTNFGEVGDMRLLIMTALEISDELAETRRQAESQQAELEELRGSRSAVNEQLATAQSAVAKTLESAALRVERLTASLNGAPVRE